MIGTRAAIPFLLALGLLLSMGTQLRLSGLPIGPGEAFLTLALLMLGAQTLAGFSLQVTPALQLILLFWLTFLMSQCIGFVAAGFIGDLHDTGLVVHDAATYPILIAVCVFCVVEPGARRRRQETAWWMAALGSIFCILQLIGAAGGFPIPGVDPWYWDRMRGWAANPNQFALFCLILSFVSLHLVEHTGSGRARVGASACAIIAIGTGFLAKTNAFALALAGTGALILGFFIAKSLFVSGRRMAIGSLVAHMLVFGLPLLAIAALPLEATLPPNGSLSSSFGRDNSSETDSEAQIRFELWHNAVARAAETGLLGLGPGPHLPIPAVLLDARWGVASEPTNVQHPEPGAAPNFEAHNSFLELLVQGGLLAEVSFLALIGAAFVSTFRARHHVLFASLFGMLLFGSFHVITRHPAVWFMIATCLSASDSALKTTSGLRAGELAWPSYPFQIS